MIDEEDVEMNQNVAEVQKAYNEVAIENKNIQNYNRFKEYVYSKKYLIFFIVFKEDMVNSSCIIIRNKQSMLSVKFLIFLSKPELIRLHLSLSSGKPSPKTSYF